MKMPWSRSHPMLACACLFALAAVAPTLHADVACGWRGVAGLTIARAPGADAYTLTWEPDAGAAALVRAGSAAVTHTGDPLVAPPGTSSVTLTGLDPGQRWYFEVFSRGAAAHIAERRVPLRGALNFRDLGGYPAADCRRVRWGVAFRADALNRLDASDLGYLARMGLVGVTDLRSDGEVAQAPDALPVGVAYVREPLGLPFDLADIISGRVVLDQEVMARILRDMAEAHAPVFARFVGRFAHSPGSQVVHCTGGMHRTGIAAAVLLSALGVPDDVITRDFASSEVLLEPLLRVQEAQLRALGVGETTLRAMFHTSPATITALLDDLRARYGSIDAYLAAGGLDAATLDAVRQRLLE